MRKLVFFMILFLCGIVYINRDVIVNFVLSNLNDNNVYFGEPNEYYKPYDYNFVQNTDNLYPSSKQEILNIIYSTLNRGLDKVEFYCDDNYYSCISDVNEIADSSLYLSTINNLVHPYNSYKNIHFSISDYGKVSISVERVYSEEEIAAINARVDQILASIINDSMSDYDKILAVHDYIVNNTYYDDVVSTDSNAINEAKANSAYGVLFNGKAICSGYSDTLAIFLTRLGFNNYKISSDFHIWNLVYYNGEWKHIDATWDDPVTVDGNNLLLHDFFLIYTYELVDREGSYEMDNHDFNRNFYSEAR